MFRKFLKILSTILDFIEETLPCPDEPSYKNEVSYKNIDYKKNKR